jgi:predicted transcriptional regulator
MKISKLFFELSHEARYNIFREINESPYKHSELEKKLDLPGPEITRHIKRLQKYNLIEKTPDRTYFRTNLGKLVNEGLDFFEFSVNFRDFINSHDIDAFPSELLLDLGILKNCSLLTKTMENIELWSTIIKNARSFIWSITEQAINTDLPMIQQKILNQNLDIKSIMHENLLKKYVQTEEWESYIEGPKPEIFRELSEKIGIPDCIRKIDKVKLVLLITESQVILFLSDKTKIDYSECIYSESNKGFIEWAKKLFEYYWQEAKRVNKKELLL